jgi:hypothetical protein
MDNPILIHAQAVGRTAFGAPRLVKRGRNYMSPSAPNTVRLSGFLPQKLGSRERHEQVSGLAIMDWS